MYGAETWALGKVNQRYMENFEMWCWRRMEEIGGADRVYMKQCYVQCDVTPCVFYLPNMLVFFFLSVQLATWHLYNYPCLVLDRFIYGGHNLCVM